MVAVIKTGHSLHRTLNYNENKVKEGLARCIGQGNYPLDVNKMSLTMKLNRLLKRAELNSNVSRNSVHISLNFDPSERLSQEKLMLIADAYMEKIGFGKQPYLIYQHYDSGHPHIHLVTTNIEANGNRIGLHHLGIRKSEPARKAIEEAFGLIKAENQKRSLQQLKPISAQKVQYGKSTTKRAIQNVLENVLDTYKYSSLPELNAILGQYNVKAERGGETSRMYRNNGLVYRVLDSEGNPIGVPIKASLFYNKPTLKNLEKRFSDNKQGKARHKLRLKNTIDKALLREGNSGLDKLIKALDKQGVHTVLRQSQEGQLYGITFVDHRTQCVFNGSELGKPYSAKAITERCGSSKVPEPKLLSHSAQKPGFGLQPQHTAAETKDTAHDPDSATTKKTTETIFDTLLQIEQVPDYLPYHLKKHRKRKKRKK
ncbi:relaxase/mobilization nuclease domain-containing protein [Sinomicrobium oceani]|uniref:relaxase/mobilization nuclease domain-containing protein n=1 Tax=Sinomicrobium oceani TaxID=1150368 RepID=UPI00227B2DBF|nr:relaxase/mobilization nuclease domain-containing protein [Sinomicrobium oceani]